MATPTPSVTVAPPFAAADTTCPGPVDGLRDRSRQPCLTGKYPYISNASAPKRFPTFSTTSYPESSQRLSPSSAETATVSHQTDTSSSNHVYAALPTPGRLSESTMEAPNRSGAVALPASGQPSRPGPALGSREGVSLLLMMRQLLSFYSPQIRSCR